MGAPSRFTSATVGGILDGLRPGRDYQVTNLARSLKVDKGRVRGIMEQAADAGHVRRVTTPRGVCYRLVTPEPENEERVKPPYQNLRLGENLTDYGRTLHDFAALCMMVRR